MRKAVQLTSTTTFWYIVWILKCDAIWENLPYVAQGNFFRNNKNDLKIVMFFFSFINFDFT